MVAAAFRRPELFHGLRPSERIFFRYQAQLDGNLRQLLVQLAPFAHAQVREKILVTPLHQLFVAQAALAFALKRIPNIQIGQKIGLFVGKAFVRFVGGFARFQRALARVLNRQRGHNHQHFGHASVFLRRQQHAAHFRVDRQARHLFADFSKLVALVYRAQLQQHLKAVVDIAGIGRF